MSPKRWYMWRNTGVIFVLFWLALPLTAQHLPGDIRITASWKDVPLDSVLNRLSRQTGFRFAWSPDRISADKPVTLQVHDAPLTLALQKIASSAHAGYIVRGSRILLLPEREMRAGNKAPANAALLTVSGFVRDAASGEVLIGATITGKEPGTGTTTNPYGFFSISLPRGKQHLLISYVGFKPEHFEADLQEDLEVNFNLIEDTSLIEEVQVVSHETPGLSETGNGRLQIPVRNVQRLPSFFGEHDVVKALETVPGIQMFGDGSTFYFVRGGNRDQNLILLDDAPIFNPSHLLGLFSTVMPEAVKDIRLYRGPFPANLGGRISSVMDIRTRDGNMNRFGVEGTLGVISSKVTLEGPLKEDRSSYFISARRSWFDWFFRQQNPQLDKLRFFDLNGKTNLIINQRNRIYLSGYAGRDLFRQGSSTGNSSGIRWQNIAGSLRWYHVFGSHWFLNTTLAASSYDYHLYTSFEQQISWHSHVSNLILKSDLTRKLPGNGMLGTGIWVEGYNFNPGNFVYQNQIISPTENLVPIRNTLGYGIWLRHRTSFGMLDLDYGLRVSGWANAGATWEYTFDEQGNISGSTYYGPGSFYHNRIGLEPRAAVTFPAGTKGKFEAGYSYLLQYMHLATNSISPFTAFEVWLPSGPNLPPLRSHLVTAGYTRDIHRHTSLSVNGWIKRTRNQADFADHARMLLNPAIEGEMRTGKARAQGLELLLTHSGPGFSGHVAYTLSKTNVYIPQLNGGNPYPASYDRPHALSVQASMKAGKRWEFSGLWQIRSGTPFSSPTGFYDYRGYAVPYYVSKNNDRLPPYQRLDLSARLRLNKPGRRFSHDLTLSLYNFYGQRNPWEINFNKIILNDGQLTVPTDYYIRPEIITTQMYVFRSIPSIYYHFRF